MSEKNKGQESWPLHETCGKCESPYKITPGNAVARHYDKQPECDFILCACTNCESREIIFVNKDTLETVALCGIEILDDEALAPDEIFYRRLEAYGIEPPKSYALTNRHEKLVRSLGSILKNIPDELLYDELTSDHGHPYPEMWA